MSKFFNLKYVDRLPNRMSQWAKGDRVMIYNDSAKRRPQSITRGTVIAYGGCGVYIVRVDPQFLGDAHDDGIREVGGEILRAERKRK